MRAVVPVIAAMTKRTGDHGDSGDDDNMVTVVTMTKGVSVCPTTKKPRAVSERLMTNKPVEKNENKKTPVGAVIQ